MPTPKSDYSAEIKDLKDSIAEVQKGWPKEFGAFTKTWQQVQALSDNGSLQDVVALIEEHDKAIKDFEAETKKLQAECKEKSKKFDKLVKGGGETASLQSELMSLNMALDKERPKKLKTLEGEMKAFRKRFAELVKQLDGFKKSVLKQEKQGVYFAELIQYCDAKHDQLVKELKAAVKKDSSDVLVKQLKEVEGLKSEVRKVNQQQPGTLELANAVADSKETIPPDVAKRMKSLGLK